MAEELKQHLSRIVGRLEQARQRGAPLWPLNEVDTERLLIEPVLRALGYDDLDYRKRMQASGANYPDYLVLPGTDQVWVLEAKEWDTRLEERYERQAVQYASLNGAQWAVLTNGRTWWIYNTRASGDLAQQRVYELADISDVTCACEVLSRLSRSSVQGGDLDRAYRCQEIGSAVMAELRAGNRAIVSAIRKVVGSVLDKNISASDVREVLVTLFPGVSVSAPPVGNNVRAEETPVSACQQANSWYLLSQFVADPSLCTGSLPSAVSSDTAGVRPVDNWRDAVVCVLEDSGALERVALPFASGERGKRYFLNTEPLHSDGSDMLATRCISCGGTQVFMDVHRSSRDLLRSTHAVLQAAGVDPSHVRISLA